MWATTSPETKTEQRVAPLVVKLLTDEGVTVGEANGVLEYALGIVLAPMKEALNELRTRESSRTIKE